MSETQVEQAERQDIPDLEVTATAVGSDDAEAGPKGRVTQAPPRGMQAETLPPGVSRDSAGMFLKSTDMLHALGKSTEPPKSAGTPLSAARIKDEDIPLEQEIFKTTDRNRGQSFTVLNDSVVFIGGMRVEQTGYNIQFQVAPGVRYGLYTTPTLDEMVQFYRDRATRDGTFERMTEADYQANGLKLLRLIKRRCYAELATGRIKPFDSDDAAKRAQKVQEAAEIIKAAGGDPSGTLAQLPFVSALGGASKRIARPPVIPNPNR